MVYPWNKSNSTNIVVVAAIHSIYVHIINHAYRKHWYWNSFYQLLPLHVAVCDFQPSQPNSFTIPINYILYACLLYAWYLCWCIECITPDMHNIQQHTVVCEIMLTSWLVILVQLIGLFRARIVVCGFLVWTVLAGDCSRDWDNLTEVIDGPVHGFLKDTTPVSWVTAAGKWSSSLSSVYNLLCSVGWLNHLSDPFQLFRMWICCITCVFVYSLVNLSFSPIWNKIANSSLMSRSLGYLKK